MAVARVLILKKIKDVVPSSSTKTIDSILKSKFKSAEYHIDIRNQSNTISKTLKLIVNNDDTKVVDSVFSRIGYLNVEVNVMQSFGNINLDFKNNEIFDVNVTILKQLT